MEASPPWTINGELQFLKEIDLRKSWKSAAGPFPASQAKSACCCYIDRGMDSISGHESGESIMLKTWNKTELQWIRPTYLKDLKGWGSEWNLIASERPNSNNNYIGAIQRCRL